MVTVLSDRDHMLDLFLKHANRILYWECCVADCPITKFCSRNEPDDKWSSQGHVCYCVNSVGVRGHESLSSSAVKESDHRRSVWSCVCQAVSGGQRNELCAEGSYCTRTRQEREREEFVFKKEGLFSRKQLTFQGSLARSFYSPEN